MLDALFNPKAVAIIGASTKELSIGNRVIKNLIDFGYKGDIYPINPKADTVRGIKAYGSILDVKGPIDLVHMVIPAKFVPMAVEDCGKKEVKHIIINSGGFSETGETGTAIEKEFLKIAKSYGIRIFGPNCQGIINTDPEIKAYCNFTFTKPTQGHISIVALSGGVAEMIHQGFASRGVGTRIYASNGNACDVSIPELIEYLGDDEKTRVIVTYVEGNKDPLAFYNAVQKVSLKKPVLAMKAGRTKEGAKAAASHTGGLAKEDMMADLIFKKAGVLSFENEKDLINAAAIFSSQPMATGNRVGIITNTGGPAVIATDVLVQEGLTLSTLSNETRKTLKANLYPEASIQNPIDVLATGTSEHYRAALDALLNDDGVDLILVNFVTPFFVDTDRIAKEIAAINQTHQKPMVCNLMTDTKTWESTVDILKEGDVPFFSLPSEAAKALSSLVRYHQLKTRDKGKNASFEGIQIEKGRAIIENALKEKREILGAYEVYGILNAFGFPLAPCHITKTITSTLEAADDIGYPVVLKAESPEIIHKSDDGAVILNIENKNQLQKVAEDLQKQLSPLSFDFLIQSFVKGGVEIILGAKAQADFGHSIMFGLGGIFVEVMKDVVFELAPVSSTEAADMIRGIKGYPIIKGFRGQKGVDESALVSLIERLSFMVTALPEIDELDINPLLGFEDRVVVVDARIHLKG